MPSHIAVRCLTPFPQGTTQNVSGRKYHFAFNSLGHAVAQVAELDVATILSIGAGYQVYEEGGVDLDEVVLGNDEPIVVKLEGGEVTEELSTKFLKPTETTFKQNAKAAKADKVKAKVAAEQERIAAEKSSVHKSIASKAKDAKKPAAKKTAAKKTAAKKSGVVQSAASKAKAAA